MQRKTFWYGAVSVAICALGAWAMIAKNGDPAEKERKSFPMQLKKLHGLSFISYVKYEELGWLASGYAEDTTNKEHRLCYFVSRPGSPDGAITNVPCEGLHPDSGCKAGDLCEVEGSRCSFGGNKSNGELKCISATWKTNCWQGSYCDEDHFILGCTLPDKGELECDFDKHALVLKH